MWAGFAMVLSFLPALAAHLPLVGGLASALAGVATSLASLGGALLGSIFVVAAAWARFRPLSAASLAVAGLVGSAGQAWLLRRWHANKPVAAPGGAVPAHRPRV